MYITARLGLHSAESAHLGCALMKTCGGHRGLLTVLLIHRIHIFYGGRRTPLISFSPSLHSLSPPLPPPPPLIILHSRGVIVALCVHCLMLF